MSLTVCYIGEADPTCRDGGIGRRARLRGVWGNPCGFKSRSRHQSLGVVRIFRITSFSFFGRIFDVTCRFAFLKTYAVVRQTIFGGLEMGKRRTVLSVDEMVIQYSNFLEIIDFKMATQLFLDEQNIRNRTKRTLEWYRENLHTLRVFLERQGLSTDPRTITSQILKRHYVLHMLETLGRTGLSSIS